MLVKSIGVNKAKRSTNSHARLSRLPWRIHTDATEEPVPLLSVPKDEETRSKEMTMPGVDFNVRRNEITIEQALNQLGDQGHKSIWKPIARTVMGSWFYISVRLAQRTSGAAMVSHRTGVPIDNHSEGVPSGSVFYSSCVVAG